MINIKIIDNDNRIELDESSLIINGRVFNNLDKLCHDYILKIIKTIDSWKKQDMFMNDFECWKITVQIDESIKTYSYKEYSNNDYYIVKDLIDELVSRCINYEHD